MRQIFYQMIRRKSNLKKNETMLLNLKMHIVNITSKNIYKEKWIINYVERAIFLTMKYENIL